MGRGPSCGGSYTGREKVLKVCRTGVKGRTQAGVVARSVHTGGAVLTSVILAVVHVDLAEGAVETERAGTAGRIKTQQLQLQGQNYK